MAEQDEPFSAVHVSETPFDERRIGAVAVYCSDGRFGDQMDEFLHHGLGLPRYDRLAVPGGSACLAGHVATMQEQSAMERQLDFLVREHGLEKVVLIAHDGCAFYQRLWTGNRSTEQQQAADLANAAESIRLWHPGLAVETYFARKVDGSVAFERLDAADAAQPVIDEPPPQPPPPPPQRPEAPPVYRLADRAREAAGDVDPKLAALLKPHLHAREALLWAQRPIHQPIKPRNWSAAIVGLLILLASVRTAWVGWNSDFDAVQVLQIDVHDPAGRAFLRRALHPRTLALVGVLAGATVMMRSLRRRVPVQPALYAITSQRLLVVHYQERGPRHRVSSFTPGEDTVMKVRQRRGDVGTLVFRTPGRPPVEFAHVPALSAAEAVGRLVLRRKV